LISFGGESYLVVLVVVLVVLPMNVVVPPAADIGEEAAPGVEVEVEVTFPFLIEVDCLRCPSSRDLNREGDEE
jgi:hypothetical protein